MKQFRLFILFLLPVFVKAQSVVGGHNALQGAYPWMVNITINGSHSCGGTLISPTWVLTAGHCVTGTLSGIQVVVNDYRSESIQDGEILDINNIFLHQSFDPFQINNGFDIALIELQTPSSVTEFIDIPPQNDTTMASNGAPCKIIGWGIADTINFTFSDTLQEGDTKIMTYATCNDAFHFNGFLHNPKVLCASGNVVPVTTGSFGDSGGPMIVLKNGRWTQVGITSHGADGSKWGSVVAPAVYTKVSSYYTWIKQVSGVLSGVSENESDLFDFNLQMKKGNLHIEGNNVFEGELKIQIIDMQGRLVEDESVYLPYHTKAIIAIKGSHEGDVYAVVLKVNNKYKVVKLINEFQ